MIGDALAWTVPLHMADLEAREVPPWTSRGEMLSRIASRHGVRLGHAGDQLIYTTGRRAREAGTDLALGVAAAALLAPEGVTVFGQHFCRGHCPPRAPTAGQELLLRRYDHTLSELEALLDAAERGEAA